MQITTTGVVVAGIKLMYKSHQLSTAHLGSYQQSTRFQDFLASMVLCILLKSLFPVIRVIQFLPLRVMAVMVGEN
jgi:hypothetical protein